MMMENNKEIWNKVKTPPDSALKEIKGGRLAGMTDISPQWRFEILTELFGPCGIGWKYTIDKLWLEPVAGGEIVAFALISLYIADEDGSGWSDPIPGIGGNKLVELERAGLHVNDEAFKMAVTDAISVAAKALGVGADVYAGKTDDSKYSRPQQAANSGDNVSQLPVPGMTGEEALANQVITWGKGGNGKAPSKYHGKTFQEVWDAGADGHSYLHWVAEKSTLNPNTKKAARDFLDYIQNKPKPEIEWANPDTFVNLRSLVELAGADVEAYEEEKRKVEEMYKGKVPMKWVQAVADKMDARIAEQASNLDEMSDLGDIPGVQF
jgi:hypothetical protein